MKRDGGVLAGGKEAARRYPNKASSAASWTLTSSVDLQGRANSCWVSIEGDRLLVGNGVGDASRQWPLGRITSFRVEPAIGSCFVQAQIDGQWIDLLRQPGNSDDCLSEAIERLNAGQQLRVRQELSASAEAEWSGGHAPEKVSKLDWGGPSASPPHADEALPSSSAQDKRMRGWLWRLVRPFCRSILLLLGLSAAAVAIEVIPPLLQGALVDHVLKSEAASGNRDHLLLLLLSIVAGLLLVRLASTVVGVWKGYVSSRIGATMTADLRNQLVRKLNELPLAFHDRNQVGVLMSQVAYDTETLHTLIYHMTSGLLLQSLQLLGISIALFYLNPKLAVVTLLPMPLILAGSWYFTRQLQPRQHHYWEAVGKQASALMGMLSGIRVVKSFVQEDREIRRFCQSSRRLRDSRRTVDVSTSTFTAAMGLLFALGGLAVWYIGGRDVLFGQMTLGSLMAFLAYLAMFYAPLTSIAESTTWFANFLGTGRRISDVLDTPSEAAAAASPTPVDHLCGHVELRHVSFGYEKSRPVLHDVSFEIEPGAMVGIVGRSGSGKSTLVSLIGRLYDVDAGAILLDHVDVRQLSPGEVRRQIGMVPQEPFLFRAPIADNIAYGNEAATPREIIMAAKQADAHDFVMRAPLAYSTQLGEGGAGLSGGERQRLSIARALLFDPSILILDEATASVDAESERAICDALRRWTRRRTAIVISHRLSTLNGADQLLVFDQGRLVERGTHEELVALNGIYAKLARIQGVVHEGVIKNFANDSMHGGKTVDCQTADGREGDEVGEEFLFAPTSQTDSPHHMNGHLDAREVLWANGEIHWLEPSFAAIDVVEGSGALRLTMHGQCYSRLDAVEAFPGKYPRRFVSLRGRDASGHESEWGMVESLDGWPSVAQEALDHALRRRYLLREIREIRQMQTRENVLTLSVLTDGGLAGLRLERPGQGAQPYADNGLLLTDARGNYFVIQDRHKLPRRQQRLLSLYFGD